MRIRANKLFYLPVGGALAAGLAVSAFVLPPAQTAASQDCYGVCASMTSLALSQSTVSVGQEHQVKFSVDVDGGAGGTTTTTTTTTTADARGRGDRETGTPTGSVVVKTGSRVVCRTHLFHGYGQCSLRNRELRPGSYQIVAQYNGDRNFSPSTSGQERLTVLGRSSETWTALSLSRSTISFRRQWIEQFRARVGAEDRRFGQPTGSVTVMTDGQALCRMHLSHGQGECFLSYPLRPGAYQVVAQYSGNRRFSPSTSDQQQLTVVRH